MLPVTHSEMSLSFINFLGVCIYVHHNKNDTQKIGILLKMILCSVLYTLFASETNNKASENVLCLISN